MNQLISNRKKSQLSMTGGRHKPLTAIQSFSGMYYGNKRSWQVKSYCVCYWGFEDSSCSGCFLTLACSVTSWPDGGAGVPSGLRVGGEGWCHIVFLAGALSSLTQVVGGCVLGTGIRCRGEDLLEVTSWSRTHLRLDG